MSMTYKEAKQIIATHNRGRCEECFEGECMDQAHTFLDLWKDLEPVFEAINRFKQFEDWLKHEEHIFHNDYDEKTINKALATIERLKG